MRKVLMTRTGTLFAGEWLDDSPEPQGWTYVLQMGDYFIDPDGERFEITYLNRKVDAISFDKYYIDPAQDLTITLMRDVSSPIYVGAKETKSVIVKQGGYCVNRKRFGSRKTVGLKKCGEVTG